MQLSDRHAQKPTPCGRSPSCRGHAARLRRATSRRRGQPLFAIVRALSSSGSKYLATSHRQSERCCVVVLVDRRRQDAWLDAGRHRFQIVCLRQAPSPPAPHRENHGCEGVVGVGDNDSEHQPPPECLHIGFWERHHAAAARRQFPDNCGSRCPLRRACSWPRGTGCAVCPPGQSA